MTPALWTLAAVLLLPADAPSATDGPRKPNPFAPSLRLLTPEEEAQLDGVINRFIRYDTGQLRGDDGKKALSDFQKLTCDARRVRRFRYLAECRRPLSQSLPFQFHWITAHD